MDNTKYKLRKARRPRLWTCKKCGRQFRPRPIRCTCEVLCIHSKATRTNDVQDLGAFFPEESK